MEDGEITNAGLFSPHDSLSQILLVVRHRHPFRVTVNSAFRNQRYMSSWDTTTWIAIWALFVSVLSFFAAAWAAWVSHRALVHTRRAHDEERRITIERERSQLLEILNSSMSTLDKARIEIGALKAEFDAAPQSVQVLLKNYTQLFTEYLPRIESGARQAAALWNEVAAWDPETGIHALVQHQSRFRALLHEDQVAYEQGLHLVGRFREKLEMAREYVSQAVR